MRTTVFTALLLALCFASLARAAAAPPTSSSPANAAGSPTDSKTVAKIWPQDASDLKPDPNAHWGRLENGLRYVILPTHALPTRASLRLYMNVGSLMEADDQRGMAHFLEHLAFCGTKDFAAGDTIEFFQRLGMKFGADTNAYTTFDKTVYKLELPRANEEVLGEGLKLFRNFLDGMQLDTKQVDRERNVVLAEIRASDSAEYRAGLAGVQFLAPDSGLSKRNVLGSAVSVQSLQRARFVDFYETWYTPGRATIVAVGDFDPQLVQRLIETSFADAKARRGEQPNPDFGHIQPGQGVTARTFTSPDLQTTSVSLNIAAAAPTTIQQIADVRKELARTLAGGMLDMRLEKIAAGEGSPIQSGTAEFDHLYNLLETNSISAKCQRDAWRPALGVIEQELRRALTYGFTDAEFNEIKQYPLTALQAAADQADTNQPSDLADTLVSQLAKNQVFTHASYDLTLGKSILTEMKKADCEQALHEAWDAHEIKIWVKGNLQLTGDGTKEVLDAFRASQQVAVQPISDQSLTHWAYTDFGPVGTIAQRTNLADLQVVQAVFQNNVHVNIKQTAQEKNTVHVTIRFGGGRLELPADKPGLDRLAGVTFISGGLKAHPFNEVNRILSDKAVSVQFAVAEDAFVLGGVCMSSALDTQLQVAAAYLTAPGYRAEAYREFVDGLENFYAQLDHTADGVEARLVYPFLRSGDRRFAIASCEAMQKLTMDDLKTWLAEPLAHGFMEVTIIGDVDPDQALQAVAKTLGALPQRAAAKPQAAGERTLHFPTAEKAKEFQFESETPCAFDIVCWPTTGSRDPAIERRTRVLQDILRDRLRLKVRTELGATYTPYVLRYSNDAFPDFGYLEAQLSVDPRRVKEIGPLVAAMGAELATGHISDDEFDRAMKPVLASLDEAAHDNNYWLSVLNDCQEHPEGLDEARHDAEDYRSITKSQIEELAKQLLPADKATVINVTPTVTK